MRNEPPKRLEILEKTAAELSYFSSGNDNGDRRPCIYLPVALPETLPVAVIS
jgi:hypothetical protein